MTRLVVVDIETTGLDPDVHDPWEIALLAADTDGVELGEPDHWFVKPDLAKADPRALQVSRYYERAPHFETRADGGPKRWIAASTVAKAVAEATAGAHLVGVNPAFDARFLDVWLRKNGYAPAWDYHLVDVLALAAGRLRMRPPWRSEEVADALGVTHGAADRHTALGDCRWALEMYRACMNPSPAAAPPPAADETTDAPAAGEADA